MTRKVLQQTERFHSFVCSLIHHLANLAMPVPVPRTVLRTSWSTLTLDIDPNSVQVEVLGW